MESILGCFSPSSSVAPECAPKCAPEPKQLTPKEVHDLEKNPQEFVENLLAQLKETKNASKRKLAAAWKRHDEMMKTTAKVAQCISTSLY